MPPSTSTNEACLRETLESGMTRSAPGSRPITVVCVTENSLPASWPSTIASVTWGIARSYSTAGIESISGRYPDRGGRRQALFEHDAGTVCRDEPYPPAAGLLAGPFGRSKAELLQEQADHDLHLHHREAP